MYSVGGHIDRGWTGDSLPELATLATPRESIFRGDAELMLYDGQLRFDIARRDRTKTTSRVCCRRLFAINPADEHTNGHWCVQQSPHTHPVLYTN